MPTESQDSEIQHAGLDHGATSRSGRVGIGFEAIAYAKRLPLEDGHMTFTQARERTQQEGTHVMFVSGGHIPDITKSGLLIPDNLHHISTQEGEDALYITTAEELVKTIRDDADAGTLSPRYLFHLLNAVTQEVRTAEQFSTLAARKPQAIALFRGNIERGLQTGSNMQYLLGIVEQLQLVDNADAEIVRLQEALAISVSHITRDLRIFDTTLN